MKNKSIKKNYIFNLIYQILLVVIPLIVTPYISRVLLPEGVGKYSFALSIVTYFTLFASFGFENYAQREIAKNQEDKAAQSKIFWEIIICRSITVCISLCIYLTLFLFYDRNLELMQILTINIISAAFDIAFFFQGNEEFDKLIARSVILKVIGLILIFSFVKQVSDLKIYTLINSIIVIASALIFWPSLIGRLTKVSIKTLNPLKHLRGSFKLFIPALATVLYTMLDKTLIGLITKSDVQNGYYEQAEKIVKLSMIVITCLGAAMIPRNSHEIAQGNHKQVKQNVYNSFNFVWLLGFPMMFGIILVAENLVPWFLGDKFTYSIWLLKLFAPLVVIIGTSNILGIQYMIPYKKEKQYTISLIMGCIINLILNLILIYFYEAIGATIATIIAECGVSVTMFLFLRKELSIITILKSAIKPLIAGIIMFICCYPLTLILSASIFNTCLIVGAGILVYGVTIILLRDKLLIEAFKSIKNKFKCNRNEGE
ncbi:MAG: oligosaccharide flippase family protein [Clostridia bacterium]|nr:oligosaccharide flippase family protein [Clostridia bacterium]